MLLFAPLKRAVVLSLYFGFYLQNKVLAFISSNSQFNIIKSIHHIDRQNYDKSSVLFMHTNRVISKPDVAIIGGGPTGLATGIMLARRGYDNIQIFERFAEPPPPDSLVWSSVESERTYNIGISGRGQNVLRGIDAMDVIDKYSTKVLGRCYWEPETPIDQPMELVWTNRSYTTKCIQRDCLTSCLIQEIKSKYNHSIQIHFNAACSGVSVQKNVIHGTVGSFGSNNKICHLDFYSTNQTETKRWSINASWVIGTDGSQSSVRDSMMNILKNKVFLKKYVDNNERVYRTIPIYFDKDSDISMNSVTTALPPMVGLATSSSISATIVPPSSVSSSSSTSSSLSLDSTKQSQLPSSSISSTQKTTKRRLDLNYSIRTKIDINIDALPLKNGPYLGVILYRPWDEKLKQIQTGPDARFFFNTFFPMFSPFILDEDLEIFAKKLDSKLPIFSYFGPVLHYEKSMCLLGDPIHTVKPYFGLGLNSALEDVKCLEDSLNKHKDHLDKALSTYSKIRAKESKALVTISRNLDGGFLTFVLPLIIDSILHNKFPYIFNSNAITLLQNEKLSFTKVQFLKRRDRVLQLCLLVVVGYFIQQIGIFSWMIIRNILQFKSKFRISNLFVPLFMSIKSLLQPIIYRMPKFGF